MPLIIRTPDKEYYDETSNMFFYVEGTTLKLEHSLVSISKWESKWHKAYLSKSEKTEAELLDYINCMSLSGPIDQSVLKSLGSSEKKKIVKYMEDSMTATTISSGNKKPSREIVTSELIYYWMTALNIPFDPCQKWHINRLLTLIEVASIKQQPPKKMSKASALRKQSALNAARRAKYNTRG